ncbi:heme o synthase [soil metagenome]
MKTADVLCTPVPVLARSRFADYLELAKLRISVMVLITVAAGAILATVGPIDWLALFQTLLGTAFVATGASALNQVLERDSDALMRRTESRPLPAGRLTPLEVGIFGVVIASVGVCYLTLAGQLMAALVAAVTFLAYVFVYTPLKRVTTLNTLIGAVPGAMPPVIGWVSVRGTIDFEIVVLFLILFLWQVPHFLAIAWIYKRDYGRAGLQMLPVIDDSGLVTGRQMVSYCLALLSVSLLPLSQGRAGMLYLAGAVLLGGLFLISAIAFTRRPGLDRARSVLRASLVYLPLLLALLLIDSPH